MKQYIKYKLKRWRYYVYLIHNLPLVQFCLAYIIACVIGYRHYSLLLAIILVTFLCGRRARLILLGLVIALLRIHATFPADFATKYVPQSFSFTAEVVAEPVLNSFAQVLYINTTEIFGNIRLEVPKYPVFRIGDVLTVEAKLEKPKNFSEFDYISYLVSKQVFWVGKASRVELIGNSTSLRSFGAAIKQSLIGIIGRHVHEPRAGLLAGILLGAKANLDEEVEIDLQTVGLTHVISVSGYNFSAIFAVLLLLAGKLPRPMVMILASVGMVGFLFVVGTDNLPALRAVIMLLIALMAYFMGRKLPMGLNLLYCCTLMLVVYPFMWLSMSFQLSVLALIALILFVDALTAALRLPQWGEGFTSTLAVLLVSTPLTFSAFGTASLIAPLINMLLLPLVPLMMLLTSLGLVAFFFDRISDVCFWAADFCAQIFLTASKFAAELPIASTSSNLIVFGLFLLIAAAWVRGDYLCYQELTHESHQ